MRSMRVIMLLASILYAGFTNADSINEATNNSALISAGKNYNLMFNLEKDINFYDINRGTGLEYVQNIVNTCKQYHARCNVKVIIYDSALPLAVKDGIMKNRMLKSYVDPQRIMTLQEDGVKFIISRESLIKNRISQSDLLANIDVADSEILYEAAMVSQGFFLIHL